jgi:hypothetical protein
LFGKNPILILPAIDHFLSGQLTEWKGTNKEKGRRKLRRQTDGKREREKKNHHKNPQISHRPTLLTVSLVT